MKQRQLFLFILLGLIWGSAFVGIGIVVEKMSPWLSAALRLSIASVCLFIFVLIKKIPFLPHKSVRKKIWGLGILGIGLPFSLLFWGEQKVPAGLAGIINGSVPIWTSLFFMLKSKSRIESHVFMGVLIGFSGLVFIFFPVIWGPHTQTHATALLAILCMALCYATSNFINAKVLTQTKGLQVETTIFQQHLAACAFVWILSFFETWQIPAWNFGGREVWIALFYLGAVPSALAFLAYFTLLKEWGAIRTGAVTYLIPVSALVLDFIFKSEIPEWNAWVGIVLIFWGLLYIRKTR